MLLVQTAFMEMYCATQILLAFGLVRWRVEICRLSNDGPDVILENEHDLSFYSELGSRWWVCFIHLIRLV